MGNLFYPRRTTKDHEENLCMIIIGAVHKGPRRKPFLSTKGHEGPRRKPLQGHHLGCLQRAAEKTFFVHEGPRRTAEKTFARSSFELFTKGRRENLFYPRRATKDHEENLCKVTVWAVHKGPQRKPFLSTKGHEGPRRKPLQGHNLGCLQRAARENLFVHEGPRRTTKENLCKVIILGCPRWAAVKTFLSTKGHEGPRRNLCRVIIWAVHDGP